MTRRFIRSGCLLLCAAMALAPAAAAARGHRTVLTATITGDAGQTVTVFATQTPGDYTARFGKMIGADEKPHVIVRVLSQDGKGGRVETPFDSKNGGVPLVGGRIERIMVQFQEPGRYEIEIDEELP